MLKSGYFEYTLGYDNFDWFVNAVRKLDNKMAVCFKHPNEEIKLSGEDEKHYRDNLNLRFCGKKLIFDKLRDQCHLTDKNRSPAHIICKIDVTQKQSNFNPFVVHNLRN